MVSRCPLEKNKPVAPGENATPITRPDINWSEEALHRELRLQVAETEQWQAWYKTQARRHNETFQELRALKKKFAPVLALFEKMEAQAAFYAYYSTSLSKEVKELKRVVEEMEAGDNPVD